MADVGEDLTGSGFDEAGLVAGDAGDAGGEGDEAPVVAVGVGAPDKDLALVAFLIAGIDGEEDVAGLEAGPAGEGGHPAEAGDEPVAAVPGLALVVGAHDEELGHADEEVVAGVVGVGAGGEAELFGFGGALFGPGLKADGAGGEVAAVGLDVSVAVVVFAGQGGGPGEGDGLVVGLGEGLALVIGDEHDPVGEAVVVGEGGGDDADGEAAVGQELGNGAERVASGAFVEDAVLHDLSPDWVCGR